MVPCERYRDSLFDLMDGECDSIQKRDVEAHLKECHHCAEFLKQQRLMRSYLGQLPRVCASDGFRVLLRDRIRREVRGTRIRRAHLLVYSRRLIPAFGLIIIVVFAGTWMLFNKSSTMDSSSPGRAEIQLPTPGPDHSDVEIDYIIDEFPDQVAEFQAEDQQIDQPVKVDSLLIQRDLSGVRARLTPVSF